MIVLRASRRSPSPSSRGDRLLHVGDLLSGIVIGGCSIVSTEKKCRKMRNIGLFWVVQELLWSLFRSLSLFVGEFVFLLLLFVFWCVDVCVKCIISAQNSRFSKGMMNLFKNCQKLCLVHLGFQWSLTILQKRKETFRFCTCNRERTWMKSTEEIEWAARADIPVTHWSLVGYWQSCCCWILIRNCLFILLNNELLDLCTWSFLLILKSLVWRGTAAAHACFVISAINTGQN